jgi:hypothetical protein
MILKELSAGSGDGGGLFTGSATLFNGWLTVALFQSGYDDRGDEFLLTVVVKFDYNVLIAAR